MVIQMTREQYRQTYGVDPDFSTAKPVTSIKQPGYAQRVGEQYKRGAERIISGVEKGAEQYQAGRKQFKESPTIQGKIGGQIKSRIGLARTGLRTAGTVASTAFAPVVEAPGIKQGLEKIGEGVSKIPGADIAFQKLEQLKSKYPESAKDFEDAISLLTLGGSKKAGEKVIKSVDDSISSFGSGTKTIVKSSLSKAPEKIMQRVARVSKGKQAKFEKMANESIGKYLTKRGIYGNVDEISSQLYKRFEESKAGVDDALSKLPGKYEPVPLKTALKDLIERESRVSTPGAPSKDLAVIQNLYSKLGKEGLSMSEINQAKRLYERNIKLDYLRQNLPEGVAKANNIDNAIRKWQFSQAKKLGFKNLEEMNKETRLSKQLLDDLGAEHSGQAGNNAVTLTDWIMLSGGDPSAIGAFLTKKTFSSESVQSALAKILGKNNKIIGPVKPNMGPSQIPQLPAGKTRGVQINKPINLPKETQSTIDMREVKNPNIKTNYAKRQ